MTADYLLHLLMVLAVGTAGALIALRLKLPAAVFIGPILFVGAYQVAFGRLMDKPPWLQLLIQISVGFVLGTNFTRESFDSLKKAILPTLTVCLLMLGGGILIGTILHLFTRWPMVTAILSTAPGGQAEMALLADIVGADTEKVIVLQLLRNQLVLLIMLPAARILLCRKEGRRQ